MSNGPACGAPPTGRDWLLFIAVWPVTLLVMLALLVGLKLAPPYDPEDRG